jgi:Holliday junction DNA helicase RuvA
MIGYLQGTVASIQQGSSNRVILILDVNHVGYEVQIPPRLAQQLPALGEAFQVFTHQQIKEEQILLYGFGSAAERDLFRQLVSVSGVGAQLAIALLDTLGLPDLVRSIVTGNIRALTKTPGVGNKTAERLALELKTKLKQWRQDLVTTGSTTAAPELSIQEDVEMTLVALGYSGGEIAEALQALSQDLKLLKNPNAEDWIRRAIAWLSN